MKIPPLVLGATLLFWGWQTDFLIPGVLMGLLLEGSRFFKLRWELEDGDFKRIWTFCALLFLAAAVYAFADNGGPEGFGLFFQVPNISSERAAGMASARTAAALIRWTPMVFFLFMAAQAFSVRQEIPLHTISLILQRRWKQARKLGKPLPAAQGVDVSYPYFALCLFASSVHKNDGNSYFWGLCALLGWVLWLRRPRRFGLGVWIGALALAIAFGYSGARGMGLLQRYVDTFNFQLVARIFRRNQTDPSKSQTQIGQIGAIETSPRIVIWLKPRGGEFPAYLREASYRTFRSPTWYANRSTRTFTQILPSVTNETTWPLGIAKTNISRIGITCYLPDRDRETHNPVGLLPLPSGSARLENFPAYVIKKSTAGAVLAEGPGLVQFDAVYGPGLTIDGAPATDAEVPSAIFPHYRTNPDLAVPTNEIPALEKVVSELRLRGQDRDQAMKTISEFFATKFTYCLWQDADNEPGTNRTPLGRFLLKTRAGHCEYFATATVLLLREIGIPARYAVGYSVHEAGWDGYVVRQSDAHAWCLVWNDQKKVWQDFDTTPGTGLNAGAHQSHWLSDLWWWARFEFSKLRWGQTHLRNYILIGLVPVLALILIQIVRQRRRRGNQGSARKRPAIWPGVDSEFYQIEKELAERGFVRGANEPLADWLERAAAAPAFDDVKNSLRVLVRLHYRYRFDPQGLNTADREQLRREARNCLDQLSHVEHAANVA
ncbi:MAG TPA: transglutaminase domain-containing protein [Candidatus Angelobacter sp.]|nr:transglutaminase domain-containing protein [Candidatus Angelobacter sp.]